MGLDWNPLGKPQPGYEDEYFSLLGQIAKPEEWFQPSPIPFSTPIEQNREKLLKQWFAIQVSPYETLNAPRVGRDPEADAWIRSKYETAPNKPNSIDEWVQKFQGYYAIDLVPENDGLPVYCNYELGGNIWERWGFRAQFFDNCKDVLGENLYYEAWQNHLPFQLAGYGNRLMNCARKYADANGVSDVLQQRVVEWSDEDPYVKAHIIASAARWATYWSSHGHGLHANY